MADTGKKIDRYIDSLLSQAEVPDTSPEFTKFLMERVGHEYRAVLEERKRDRAARYIMGFLIIFILGVSFTLGYVLGSKGSTGGSSVVDIWLPFRFAILDRSGFCESWIRANTAWGAGSSLNGVLKMVFLSD